MFHTRSTGAETSRLACICSNAAAEGTPFIIDMLTTTSKATPIMIEDGSGILLLTTFEYIVIVFVIIVKYTGLNFRYNHCLPMRRNFVT
jgi:hypothetical protein